MKVAIIVLKLALTVGIAVWVFRSVDLAASVSAIRSIAPGSLVIVTIVIFLQKWIWAVRQSQVALAVSQNLAAWPSFRIVLLAAFLSQTLATFISGDLGRLIGLNREGLPFREAFSVVVLDRVLGMAGLAGLMATCLPWSLQIIPDASARASLLLLAGVSVGGVLLFLVLGVVKLPTTSSKALNEFIFNAAMSRYLLANRRIGLSALAASVVIHFLNVVTVYTLCRGLSVDVTFLQCLLLTTPVFLIMMVPISVAGWGVREGAMIVALGAANVSASDAVAVSVVFGIAILVTSLIGGAIWLLTASKKSQSGSEYGWKHHLRRP